MTAPHPECQPGCADAPETLLRGWAKAYRDTPEYRFPSDPHAEFFPVDLEFAADRIEELTKALEEIRDHPAKYDDGKRSYAVGWAFWNLQNRARRALVPSLEDRK